MRISIRNGISYLIQFDHIQVHGGKALAGYAFTFTLNGKRSVNEFPSVIFDITLSLSTVLQERQIISSIPSSPQLIQFVKSAESERADFLVILSKEQINAIEEYRQEKDLQLNFGLSALTSLSGLIDKSFDCVDATIPREQWLKALKDSGFRQTILFEIPMPEVDEAFGAFISKAQEFLEIGHYKDAVMQCRHILETIESVRSDKKLSSSANDKAHSNERKDMTAIERMLSLREQLKNVCQLGAHGSEFFTRSQAKAVLSMTLVLLAEPTVGV